jgi:hypothetical protein
MTTLEELWENAENCALLAEEAKTEPTRRRFERMQQAWLALIETEAWLAGNVSPIPLRTATLGQKSA